MLSSVVAPSTWEIPMPNARKTVRLRWLSLVLLVGTLEVLWSPTAHPQAAFDSAEELARSVYDLVSFEPGTTPDWEQVRSAFLPQAIVVLRTSRDSTSVFTLDGFVQDFVSFIERANVRETGFRERVVKTSATVFGDMAHVLVLYEAHITGSPRPPQQGVDSFQLIRRDGRWWIVSITNEIPTADRPIPAALR
jgi:hypothetical protein